MAGRRLTRGEVRFVRFPPPDKQRPALLLTRDSALAYLSRVTVAPIASTIRGVPSEVALGPEDEDSEQPCAVWSAHNVSHKDGKSGAGGPANLPAPRHAHEDDVCAALEFALGCGR